MIKKKIKSSIISIDDLNDVDTSIKSNGYTLQYDSNVSKFVSKPLPSISGAANNVYQVELSRWGIAQGIPNKPYVDAHYIMADNNIQGINNAISWASANGFNYVLMPKGNYALCYPRSIMITQSNLTFDMNGSTFKVIYDSDRKSPFDNRVDAQGQPKTDYWNWPTNATSSMSIKLEGVTNSHVINGTMIGCKADRSFVNASQERANEWTTAIQFTKGTCFSSVRNCNLSYYMADGIGWLNSSRADYVEFSLTLTANDLDTTTGQPIASSNRLITQMIAIPAGSPVYNSFLIKGQGFTRQTGLITKDVGIYYYKSDNTFMGAIHNRKIYTPMTIPQGATKFRFVFYNETDTSRTSSSQLAIHLMFGLTPHHNIVEHNEIFGCHRGGIQPGGNDNIIQHNVIHDIGNGANGISFLDGKPTFSDPTQYAINQEDSYGDGTIIRDNIIYGCLTGILCGAYDALIENNRIYNSGLVGINLYTMYKGVVKDNFIYKCSSTIGLMTSHFSQAHVTIKDNTLVGGNTDWNSGSGYHIISDGNIFIDPSNITLINDEISIFKNNHIKLSTNYSGAPTITVNRLDGCTFEATGSKKDITLKAYEIARSVFSNINVKLNTRNQSTLREDVSINDCKFNNCILDNQIDNIKQRKVLINKSKLTDTNVKVGNLNTPNEIPSTIISECDIFVNSLSYFFQSFTNGANIIFEASKCNFEITNTGFQHLINHVFTAGAPPIVTVTLKENEFKYSGGTNLAFAFYNSKNPMKALISSRNIFTNITLPTRDAIFIGYDPLIQSVGEPSAGVFFVGDLRKNAAPSSGSPMYYACIVSSGVPDDMPRIANKTNWNASTTKVKGDQVNASGHVYECIVAGTTGSSTPTWATTSGATVVDNNVTWKEIGYLAEFRSFGILA